MKKILFLCLFLVSCINPSFSDLASSVQDVSVMVGDTERPFCSGVIVAKNRVLTNDHCVAFGGKEGVIYFKDGTTKPYKTLKSGNYLTSPDLALLETETDIPPVKFGEMPKVGDLAVAVGTPYKLGWTFTLGVISYVEREIDSGKFIQHDALINPGSSGGGLFNLNGELIGLNARGGEGIGFAVPITQIKEFLEE